MSLSRLSRCSITFTIVTLVACNRIDVRHVVLVALFHTRQMGKGRPEIKIDPEEMAQAQARMGYRGPSTEPYAIDHKDPTGEAAYQKAFAEAAKMKPARVPNADFYTNSSSAQEFIRRRDQKLFPPRSNATRETKQNVSYEPAQPDIHRVARNALNGPPPNSHHMHPSPTGPHGGRHGAHQNYDYRSNGAQPPPLLLEPKFGPAGPDRKLR